MCVKIGDQILVKVTEIDKQGRVNLSRKAILKEQKEAANPSQSVISVGYTFLKKGMRFLTECVCLFFRKTLSLYYGD